MADKKQMQGSSGDARSAVIVALRAQMDALQHSSGASAESAQNRRTAILPADEHADEGTRFSGVTRRPARGKSSESGRSGAGKADAQDEVDSKKKAFDRIVMLCSYHDYSREKMRQRLKREQVDEYAAEDALERAVECGLIDDIRYGEALCAGRMRAGKGTDGIESELWDNHIDPARIPGWPEEYEQRYGNDLDRALRLIERHPPRSKRPRDSAYRRLRGKGYSSDIASKAAGIWWSRQQSES
ncbi:MAG: regulatory protein RecX [Eggerthellaceae bacterium]